MRREKQRLFQAEIVLPVQFFDSARGQVLRRTGECQLLAAVLTDAIDCYRNNCHARDARKRKVFEEAERWIMRKGDTFVFSFENICGVLGIDPGSLRRGLQQWRSAQHVPAATAASDAMPGAGGTRPRSQDCGEALASLPATDCSQVGGADSHARGTQLSDQPTSGPQCLAPAPTLP